jgi:hypothetical protein
MNIEGIKNLSDRNINVQSPSDRVKANEVREVNDAIINEIRDRGVLQVEDIEALETLSIAETKFVYVKNLGLYFATLVNDTDPTTANGANGTFWIKVLKYLTQDEEYGEVRLYGKFEDIFRPVLVSNGVDLKIYADTHVLIEYNKENNIVRFLSASEDGMLVKDNESVLQVGRYLGQVFGSLDGMDIDSAQRKFFFGGGVGIGYNTGVYIKDDAPNSDVDITLLLEDAPALKVNKKFTEMNVAGIEPIFKAAFGDFGNNVFSGIHDIRFKIAKFEISSDTINLFAENREDALPSAGHAGDATTYIITETSGDSSSAILPNPQDFVGRMINICRPKFFNAYDNGTLIIEVQANGQLEQEDGSVANTMGIPPNGKRTFQSDSIMWRLISWSN